VGQESGKGKWSTAGLLAVGDFLSFSAFAAIGLQSHQHTAQLRDVVATAVPFAIGWYTISPFAGAFSQKLIRRSGLMLARTSIAWVSAWPLALLLRWAFASDHFMNLSFALVILFVNFAFLCGWRLALSLGVRIFDRVRG